MVKGSSSRPDVRRDVFLRLRGRRGLDAVRGPLASLGRVRRGRGLERGRGLAMALAAVPVPRLLALPEAGAGEVPDAGHDGGLDDYEDDIAAAVFGVEPSFAQHLEERGPPTASVADELPAHECHAGDLVGVVQVRLDLQVHRAVDDRAQRLRGRVLVLLTDWDVVHSEDEAAFGLAGDPEAHVVEHRAGDATDDEVPLLLGGPFFALLVAGLALVSHGVFSFSGDSASEMESVLLGRAL